MQLQHFGCFSGFKLLGVFLLLSDYLPHGFPIPWVSPCVSYHSQHTSPPQDPSTLTLGGLHPWLQGRGQVAASLGAWGLKKDEIGQKIYGKEDIMRYLLFLMCVATFVEARGVLWGVKSEINSWSRFKLRFKPAINNRFGGLQCDQKGQGDKEGQGMA